MTAPGDGNKLILLLANETGQRQLGTLLRGWGYRTVGASSADEAARVLARTRVQCTLVDLTGVATDAAEALGRMAPEGVELGPVVLLADGPNLAVADQSALLAADEVLLAPFKPEELVNTLAEVVSPSRRPAPAPTAEEARLRREIALCSTEPMREVWDIVRRAAGVDVTVLVSGETGTGKDLVARAIHHLSARRSQPFVKVNCAAVPRELLESELFGHERGAFTGAHQLKIGKFEAANRGTMFLDEIGELHPALQAKLLQVLQDGTFSRVGGKSPIMVDVRILAATNQDLERAVLAEQFREDLYYRLNVVQVTVPPLRERRGEIPLLVQYFIQRYSRLYNRPEVVPAPEALERLLRHPYPGNVRELENIIKRMIVLNDPLLARTPLTQPRDGHEATAPVPVWEQEPSNGVSLKEIARNAARAAEREAIARILDQTRWNRVKAAKLLKISYRALLYKIKDVGLSRDRAIVRSSPSSII
jgi:two-component system response regulator AtoC